MAIFNWQCGSCSKITRRLLRERPTLTPCECGGTVEFITEPTSRIIEVRDNGLMPKKVEQLSNIEELIKNR